VVYSPRVVYRREPYRYAYAGPYLPSRRVFGLGIYYGPSFGGYYRDPYYYRSRVDYGYRPDYGYYAGTVDDFDGAFQSLKLESGAYTIRLESPGYEPMEFDVRITPGQKITYREDLRRE
jgi:hypothetical protein